MSRYHHLANRGDRPIFFSKIQTLGTGPMLSADELGEKGESRFRELCADAGLICNKSDRDRTGWDFLVEFPFESPASVTLDHRRSPISCFVQVKTLQYTTRRVPMKLSVAERLAKEVRPAFICILRVGKKNQFLDAYLIHILDERLAFVLKRLRQEEARGTDHTKINKKTITWNLDESERIKVSGPSLRDAMVAACKGDLLEYTEKKGDQLKKLGFSSQPFFINFSMTSKVDELADVLLGLKGKLPARIESFGEERFGITLARSVGQEVNVSLTPNSNDHYSLQFRPEDGVQPALFDAACFQLSLPPPLALQNRVLFKSKLFDLTFSRTDEENTRITLTSTYQDTDSHPINSWINYWRMAQIIASGEGELLLRRKQDHSLSRLPLRLFGKGTSQQSADYFSLLCNDLAYIYKQAGISPEPSASLQELMRKEDHIRSVCKLLRSQPPDQIIESPFEAEIDGLESQQPIFAARICVGGVAIGCYAVISLSGTREDDLVRWNILKVSPKFARQIAMDEEAFLSFIEEAKKLENIEAAISYSDFKEPD